MTRPLRLKHPKRRRERDTRPATSFMQEWVRLKREEPVRFERMTKGKEALRSSIDHYERTVKE